MKKPLALGGVLLAASCGGGGGPEPWFVEDAARSGLDFRHVSALEQRFHFPRSWAEAWA